MPTVQSVIKQSKKRLSQTRQQKVNVSMHEHPTPYMMIDLHDVQEKAVHFKKLMPRVGIYYAIKANNDARIIKSLKPHVEGYDVASLGEAEYLVQLGIAPSSIVYSNPVKVPSHIAGAYKLGVRYFAFDSLVEIEKLAKYAPGSNVYLRLKVSDYGSKFPLSSKFGIDAQYAADYCSMATDFGLHVKGVTFHVGSQSENPQVWGYAIKEAGSVIEQLHTKGIDVEFLNLGGGFPADYGDPIPGLRQAASVINHALKEYIPEGIRVMAEPGRHMVAGAGTIVTSVIGRESRSGTDWLYLDVGAFQGLIEPLEMPNLRYPIQTEKHPRGSKRAFVLSGPTCDACDTLGSDYVLPADMNVGDRLAIRSTGAYSLVYASHFNGFEPPKVYYREKRGK